MIKVNFVCMGNICRSPTAEGVFRKLVEDKGLLQHFEIDSSGILDYHEGEKPDPRTIEAARKRGYNLSVIRSRPVDFEDFKTFHYILAMDSSNLKNLNELCPEKYKEDLTMCLFLDYSDNYKGESVPDPYFGGTDGFEKVLNMIEEACEGFLKQICNDHDIAFE